MELALITAFHKIMKELEDSQLRFFICGFACCMNDASKFNSKTFLINSRHIPLFEFCFLETGGSIYNYKGNYNYNQKYEKLIDRVEAGDEVREYTQNILKSNAADVAKILTKLFEDKLGKKTAEISVDSIEYVYNGGTSIKFRVDILGDIDKANIIQYMINAKSTTM